MSRLSNFTIGIMLDAVPMAARSSQCILLAVWLGNVANGKQRTVAFKLAEAAADLGVDYYTVQSWWGTLVGYEGVFVCEVENKARRGIFCRLGKAYKQANEATGMAVLVYCKACGVGRPGPEERVLIGEAVGTAVNELKQWRGVCEAWVAGGKNPLNVEGLLDVWGKRKLLREGFGGKNQEPRAKSQELRVKSQEPDYGRVDY